MYDVLLRLLHRIDQRATALSEDLIAELEAVLPLLFSDMSRLQNELLRGEFSEEPLSRQQRMMDALRTEIEKRLEATYLTMNATIDEAVEDVVLTSSAVTLFSMGLKKGSIDTILGRNSKNVILKVSTRKPSFNRVQIINGKRLLIADQVEIIMELEHNGKPIPKKAPDEISISWENARKRIAKQWREFSTVEGLMINEWMDKLEKSTADRITASLR